MATKINDTVEFLGNRYVAVEYTERPVDFFPTGDDDQCRICQLSPNYCKMKDDCHGFPAFVFVRAEYIEALNRSNT